MADKYKSSASIIPLNRAVGKVLAHDITEIRPGQFKGPAFKKGHVVRPEDMDHLRRLGKNHLWVLDIQPGEIHENDAALLLGRAFAGPGVVFSETPEEGKISFRSEHGGLLKINVPALTEINLIPDLCCSSRHTNTLVEAGEILAATRVIPLVAPEDHVLRAVEAATAVGGLFQVKPLATPDVGLVVTGNEVVSGLIEDKFAPLLRKKMESFGCSIPWTRYAPDDRTFIRGAIRELLESGAGLLLVAGGMSVDPDDVSRLAVADAGALDVVYGTPVLPGAMFLYGRVGSVPILGLPACILFYRATVLDLLLPRVLAGEKITRRDLAAMAHGGLCLNCETCRYPVCPFGKSCTAS